MVLELKSTVVWLGLKLFWDLSHIMLFYQQFAMPIMIWNWPLFDWTGSAVCVRCEREATRNYLGNRCSGHGVVGRITRWTSLTNVNCMGKWVRRPDPDASSNDLCRCGADASFIFVWCPFVERFLHAPSILFKGLTTFLWFAFYAFVFHFIDRITTRCPTQAHQCIPNRKQWRFQPSDHLPIYSSITNLIAILKNAVDFIFQSRRIYA